MALATLLLLLGCSGTLDTGPGETADSTGDGDTTDTADTGDTSTDCVTGPDLPAALLAAAPGDTVAICAGTWEAALVIDRDLTLTGEGAVTLDAGGAGSVVRVDGATVTLRGLTLTGGVGTPVGERVGGGLYAGAGTVVTLDGVLVTANTAGRGGGVYTEGELHLVATHIEANTASVGGGIAAGDAASVDADPDALVSTNTADQGGGVALTGSASVTGLQLRYNDGNELGGALVVLGDDVDVRLTDVDASDNGSDGRGGGLGIEAGGTVTLDGVYVHDCAAGSGGGIAVQAAAGQVIAIAAVGDAVIEANSATSGGGVSLSPENGAGIALVGLTLVGNRAEIAGGLAFGDALGDAGSVPLRLEAISLRENVATTLGGGAYLSVSGPFDAVGVVVEGNEAGAYGGGVFLGSRAATPVIGGDVQVADNHAALGGGVVLACPVDLDATVTLDGWIVTGNHADTAAGGLALATWEGSTGACDVGATALTLTGNTTDGDGGGLLVALPGGLTLDGVTITGNAAAVRGGGATLTAGVVTSFASDWGDGADDNAPDDVALPATTYAGYGAAAAFTCDLSTCEAATP